MTELHVRIVLFGIAIVLIIVVFVKNFKKSYHSEVKKMDDDTIEHRDFSVEKMRDDIK